jgi:hypothetical protein
MRMKDQPWIILLATCSPQCREDPISSTDPCRVVIGHSWSSFPPHSCLTVYAVEVVFLNETVE